MVIVREYVWFDCEKAGDANIALLIIAMKLTKSTHPRAAVSRLFAIDIGAFMVGL